MNNWIQTIKNTKGGSGSGNFGHAGRQGKVGGSSSSSIGSNNDAVDAGKLTALSSEYFSGKPEKTTLKDGRELFQYSTKREDGKKQKLILYKKTDGKYYARVLGGHSASLNTWAQSDTWDNSEQAIDQAIGNSKQFLKKNTNDTKSIFIDTQVSIGSTLKALPDGVIGGHLILFGDPANKDFDKQYFNKSTYYGHNNGSGAEVVFNHRRPVAIQGMDAATSTELKSLSKRFMKNPLKTTVDTLGIFAEVVMDMSDSYEKAIYDLAAKGALKFSAGAAPHLVDVAADGHIKSFVITEGSLTPVPMEYRMLNHRVLPLKSLMKQIEDFALQQN